MKMFHWLIGFALIGTTSNAQISDDFSDGNLHNHPQWLGQVDSFSITMQQELQLTASHEGSAYISTLSAGWSLTSWQIRVRLDFNPSASNLCKIYLASDRPDLNGNVQGIYVLIGGTADEVSLYQQNGALTERLIDGSGAYPNSGFVELEIMVTLSEPNTWELYTKLATHTSFTVVGSAFEPTLPSNNYLGILCTYTKTRADKFFFDDLMVNGTSRSDVAKPVLQELVARDPHRLELTFNEAVHHDISVSHFYIDGFGAPDSLNQINPDLLHIYFADGFKSGLSYTLNGTNIPDLFGNLLSLDRPFTYHEKGEIDPFEVIITEIMADPHPQISQPDKEYVEIYNRSAEPLDLIDLTISDLTKTTPLGEYVMSPGEYVVLCPNARQLDFPDSIKVIGLANWPSLNNDGDQISLKADDRLIHLVPYQSDWYRSTLKQYGGWSLEMIDLGYPCSGQSNWAASQDLSGGTPGSKNSFTGSNPDLQPPTITSTYALSLDTIIVNFDQQLDNQSLGAINIALSPEILINSLIVDGPALDQLILVLEEHLLLGQIYQIQISNLSDCNGNAILDQPVFGLVGLPEEADSGDVVINEILFNPRPLGARFVEVYNRSEKAINLSGWQFARWQSTSVVDLKRLPDIPLMIYPGQYLAFTENPQSIKEQYPLCAQAPIALISDLPSMPDNQGSMILLNAKAQPIDQLYYHQDMHHPLLHDKNGVSLERIAFDISGLLTNNWASAAETNGYATPGKINSQYITTPRGSYLSVSPQVFQPSSAVEYAQINYRFDEPGNTIQVSVYDARGRHVVDLANNSLVGSQGTLLWDGTADNLLPVPMGYYIIFLRSLTPQGHVTIRKETLVVAPDF